MYQQINLYQPVFRQQHKIFSARTLLLALVTVAVLLLGIYAHARWALATLDHTATSIEQQYQQLDTQLGNLELINQSSNPGALENEIAQLQHNITEQQTLLDSFGQLSITPAAGFGEFFETLARQTLPGIWLTGIRLTQDGETELRGTTLDPELVPGYLQLLPDQSRFKSLQQGSVHMVRHDPDKAEIEFVLRSTNIKEL